MEADNPFNLLLPAAMVKVAEDAAIYKATKHPFTTFFLAINAGVFISIAFVFYMTATTGSGATPYGIAKLIGGISLGLMLVVVCGADLFISTVLIVVAKAGVRISWGQLAATGLMSISAIWLAHSFLSH